MSKDKPSLYTCLSPALLNLFEVKDSIVVVIDVLRATSTIATALYNGAEAVIPVDDISRCIAIGQACNGITAGERDGKIAEGLNYGNSPFEYPEEFVKDRTLVLTTTNGTKLLHMAVARGADHIITGSFPNLGAICDYLIAKRKNVILACAAWKDRVNIEDTLFAGAVISVVKEYFEINCDSSQIAETLYEAGRADLYEFLKTKQASHYKRLTGFGLEKDLRYCLSADVANVLPLFFEGKLTLHPVNAPMG